jgi:hypothetical protein
MTDRVVRLYGPWAGVEESDGKATALHLARTFNIEADGNNLQTRPGRKPFGCAVTAPKGMFQWRGDIYVGGAFGFYVVPHGTTTATLLHSATPKADAHWYSVGWLRYLVYGSAGAGLRWRDPDGNTGTLNAVPGLDALYFSYLTSLPAFVSTAVYQSRLYGLTADGVVLFSESDANLEAIPVDGTAPLGGANLWLAESNFDAKTGVDDSGKALVTYSGALVILTHRGLFAWDGSSLYQVGGGGNGTVSARSVVSLPVGVAYLGEDGPRLFRGGDSELLETGYEETLQKFTNHGAWKNAIGVHVPRRREYRLYIPSWKGSANDLCLVWNYADDRWFLWGGTPPWLSTSSVLYLDAAVGGAAVLDDEPAGPMLVTAKSDGTLWIEDDGLFDSDGAGQFPIYSSVAFDRLGLGETEEDKTWRDVRVEAKATGAYLKLAMLANGEEFFSCVGDSTRLRGVTERGVDALLTNQTQWGADSPAYRQTGVTTQGPVGTWASWPLPHARVARTMQPVVWCDGADEAGNKACSRMVLRGLELKTRVEGGRP